MAKASKQTRLVVVHEGHRQYWMMAGLQDWQDSPALLVAQQRRVEKHSLKIGRSPKERRGAGLGKHWLFL